MMEVGLIHYNVLSGALFAIGIFGILLNKRSIIRVLISAEIILLAANLNFVVFSSFLMDIKGQIFSILVLGVAAAEIGIGLAILVIYFKSKGDIKIENLDSIKDAYV